MRRRTLLTGAGAAGLVGLSSVRPARADTLDEVKKRGTLVVGMEVAYVPYEFFKDGKIVGYDPDIIAEMMPKLGVKAQLVDTAWNGIIPALYAKKFDCIVSAMTITKERADKVLFSMPYADASNVIFLRADETIVKTADDLSGKVIGVQLGSAAAVIAKTFEDKMKAKGLAGYKEVKQYEHYPEAYQDLLNKRVDAVVNSKSTLMVVIGTSGNVYPAANFVHWARQAGARTVYVGPERPLNAEAFTQIVAGKAGEVLPGLFEVRD